MDRGCILEGLVKRPTIFVQEVESILGLEGGSKEGEPSHLIFTWKSQDGVVLKFLAVPVDFRSTVDTANFFSIALLAAPMPKK